MLVDSPENVQLRSLTDCPTHFCYRHPANVLASSTRAGPLSYRPHGSGARGKPLAFSRRRVYGIRSPWFARARLSRARPERRTVRLTPPLGALQGDGMNGPLVQLATRVPESLRRAVKISRTESEVSIEDFVARALSLRLERLTRADGHRGRSRAARR